MKKKLDVDGSLATCRLRGFSPATHIQNECNNVKLFYSYSFIIHVILIVKFNSVSGRF